MPEMQALLSDLKAEYPLQSCTISQNLIHYGKALRDIGAEIGKFDRCEAKTEILWKAVSVKHELKEFCLELEQ